MVDPDSNGISRVPPYLGTAFRKISGFRLQGFHLLWPDVPVGSANPRFCNFPSLLPKAPTPPRDTPTATPAGLAQMGFRLIPFRSPLLRESRLFSFPGGTEMVHFPPLTSGRYEFTAGHSIRVSLLIRGSPDQSLFTAPRGLTQLTTPFIVSKRQGILRVPLVAWHRTLNPSAVVFKHCPGKETMNTRAGFNDGSRKFVFRLPWFDIYFTYRFQLSKNGGIGLRKRALAHFLHVIP